MTEPQDFAARLDAHFRHVHQTTMRDLPICNEALRVESFGFRDFEHFWIGATVTPWFLNIFAAPKPSCDSEARDSAAFELADCTLNLPAGAVDFAAHDYPGLGRLLSCSLFSPMDIFVDHEAAAATAIASLDLLFAAPEQTKAEPEKPALDRRAFFRFASREARP